MSSHRRITSSDPSSNLHCIQSPDAVSTVGSVTNLASSALNLINSSSPVHQVTRNIVRWLGRECISEDDFQYCLEQCHGLAYPNEIGLQLREGILKSQNKAARAGGIYLVTSGAIGRWVAFTQDHAYLVTTVAAITRYHNMEFAVHVLCRMALNNHSKSGSNNSKQGKNFRSRSYAVDAARLHGVLSKIVDSIYLNVVNAGHTLDELPQELQLLYNNSTDSEAFADIILKIAESSTDMMLLSAEFHGDLLLWILAHFEGLVTVSVAGKQLFKRPALHSMRQLKMVIQRADHRIFQNGDKILRHEIEVMELFGDSWKCNLHVSSDPICHNIENRHRKALYLIDEPGTVLSNEEVYKVKEVGYRLIAWILGLRLQTFEGERFKINHTDSSSDNSLNVADIVYRLPKTTNSKELGFKKLEPLAFLRPDLATTTTTLADDVSSDALDGKTSALVSCFPALKDLLENVSNRCNCGACQNKRTIDDCKKGCLRLRVLSSLFTLTGHAIADSMGANDAHGQSDFDDQLSWLVQRVLCRLVVGSILWDEWFIVAVSVILGISSSTRGTQVSSNVNHIRAEGALVAIQHGSLVVVAKWLDLTRPIIPAQCFTVEIAEGQLPGIHDTTAFLRSEISDFSHNMQPLSVLKRGTHQECTSVKESFRKIESYKDPSDYSITHGIIGASKSGSFRLITFVTAGTSEKIINPLDTLMAASKSVFIEHGKYHCRHVIGPAGKNDSKHHKKNEDGGKIRDKDDCEEHTVSIWTFEEVLADWIPYQSSGAEIVATVSLDSVAKKNTALALAGPCVVKEAQACMLCAVQELAAIPKESARIISYHIDSLIPFNDV